MERQRNMTQIKEQKKFTEKELNEIEASNLLDTEFKTIVLWMLKELRENFNSIKKRYRNNKKRQSEMKIKITEMKNILEGISSRLDEAKD